MASNGDGSGKIKELVCWATTAGCNFELNLEQVVGREFSCVTHSAFGKPHCFRQLNT